MTIRTTHTYVILRVSKKAFDEIKGKLRDASYEHTFHDDPDDEKEIVMDMSGIAIGKQD